MRAAEIHRDALGKATECQEELGLDPFSRVDIFACFPALGMKLMFQPLRSCAALYIPTGPYGGKAGALVNSQHPLSLQRYSASHEMGHHRFDHGPRIDRESEMRLQTRAVALEERLAEAFAAWFLMPPELSDVIFEDILQIDRARSPQEVYQAALRFGSSYTACCVHLPSLKRLGRSESEAFAKIELKKLKQELSDTPPLGGWRNDVWRLSETDLGKSLLARAGDRLIFTTGEGFEPDALPEGATLRDESSMLQELFPTARNYVIDLAPDMLARPAELRFASGSEHSSITLEVEQPREGLYVPTLSR
jgi:Zn-dependent peptidase ImmA (M78 family)